MPEAKSKAKAKAKAAAREGVEDVEPEEAEGEVAEAKSKAQAKAKAKAKAKATAREGVEDLENEGMDDEVPAAKSKAKAKPKAKGQGKAKGQTKAEPVTTTEDSSKLGAAGGSVATADSSLVPAASAASTNAMSLFPNSLVGITDNPKELCDVCGVLTDFKALRIKNKGSAKFKCLKCETTTSQLRRHYGQWPVPGFSLLDEAT